MKATRHLMSRTTMNRRALLRAAGLGGAGALTLAAGGRGPLGSSLTAAAPAAQGTTKITFWTPGGSPAFCDVHTQIAKDYAAVEPKVAVDFQCGTDSEAFAERLLGSIAAGNPPEATIIWDTPVSFGVRGALRPLDDLMKAAKYSQVENWPAAVLKSCQFNGKTYGLPVTAGTYGIWYNQEMFEAKGIPTDRASFPKTWDELRKLSKEFTQWKGDKLVSAGFVLFEPTDLPYTLPVWSALNGGKLYDAANQRYSIDAESNTAMMEYFVSWLDEEYQGDINKVKRSGSWRPYPSDEGQPPEFQAGHLAGVEWGSWGMGDFYAYGDPAFQKWEVAPYPVGPGGKSVVSAYWPNWLVIPDGTEHPEEAFAYLDFMSGVGVAKWFAAIPDLPTNARVANVVPEVAAKKRDEAVAEDATAFFRTQLDVATPMWDSPVQSFAIDQLRGAIERILAKESPPSDALAEAQKACQAELEKALKGAS